MNMSFVVHIKRSELRPAEEPADTQDNTRLLSIK